ncbi:hypothetical protein C6497_05720 [Candidatus Poribacteria bacterium]|nr:MAG: hypothetical protein C6497_05720 [Candidatus Poribacteria bacterium]
MSMFREHWLGGLTAYSIFFILSLVTTLTISIFYGTPFDWNPTITLDPLEIVGCFVIALLFGLWPDVDITSKSQKIFYSVLFVVNFSLILFLRRYLESAIIGLLAMLPILSKHRGWTHSKVTMFLLPMLFMLIPIYSEYSNWHWSLNWEILLQQIVSIITWERLPTVAQRGFAFYLAGLIGYASHLYLDGILIGTRKTKGKKAYTI